MNSDIMKDKYTVDIDFDKASTEWKANKKYIGNGSYKYVCIAMTKKNKQCSNKPLQNNKYCYCHANKYN